MKLTAEFAEKENRGATSRSDGHRTMVRWRAIGAGNEAKNFFAVNENAQLRQNVMPICSGVEKSLHVSGGL